MVRGSGFTDEAFVYIGGSLVQPANTLLRDKSSLEIVLPARVAMLIKVLVVLEGTSRRLSPTFNLIEVVAE